MRDFHCPSCGQRLAFENSLCLACGSAVGYDLPLGDFRVVDAAGQVTTSTGAKHMCGNLATARCNWLAENGFRLCFCCSLTRTRPSDNDVVGLPQFGEAEAAKRRLVVELTVLGLPIIARSVDSMTGLCFDLLSSSRQFVTTGYSDGVITLDLAEGDDVHREQLRVSMDEPYRTLLGHFRHEIGHYYFMPLVGVGPALPEFTQLFGDPAVDYQQALHRHYRQGAPHSWAWDYVSSYATMHPAEDWAETFAHYLHIRDTVDTAAAFGMAPAEAALDRAHQGDRGLDLIIDQWMPLSWALNMVNRSMGHKDLYPFVLSPAALAKMRFVHRLIVGG